MWWTIRLRVWSYQHTFNTFKPLSDYNILLKGHVLLLKYFLSKRRIEFKSKLYDVPTTIDCHQHEAGRRGVEVWRWTTERRVVGSPPSGTPVITHQSRSDDWLSQFSLTNVHKGGIKHDHFHWSPTWILIYRESYHYMYFLLCSKFQANYVILYR